MPRITLRITIAVFILFCFHTVTAQDVTNRITPTATAPVITGTASAERLRFTAPNTVVQMHLQIYADSGQLLFDVTSKGNVLDWTLQDSGGEHLVPGSYLCVVTVKSLSGKLSQRVGSALVQEKQVELQRVDATLLTAAQQQAVGPIEENGALTILKAGETEAVTVVAHDGTQGEVTRSRGALSFRLGDFFSGKDKEQMRLTEEGNLGIGTDNPQAKLDVAGVIRTSKGIEFANSTDGTNGTNAPNVTKLSTTATGALQQTMPDGTVVPNATGTGTQNKIAKWTDNAGTLGDSLISESSGNVVVGNAGQTGNIQIFGTAVQDVFAGMGPDVNAGPAFNYGYAGATFGRGAGFFNVRPDALASGVNPSLRFMTTNVERMIVTNTGNVGIGTSNPGTKLDVAGPINTSTQYNIGGGRVLSVRGADNLFAGVGAGQNTGGIASNNSFFGSTAGFTNTNGSENSFFGSGSGFNSNGSNNSFFGFTAGFTNTIGDNNSYFGASTGHRNTEGSRNSFFGSLSGFSNTGSGNTFIGNSSGTSNTSEDNNTFIGSAANGAVGITNATAIGFKAKVTQSNSLVLGSINEINFASAGTNVGIGTTAPAFKLHVNDASNTGLRVLTNTAGGTVASFGGLGAFVIDTVSTVGGRFTVQESGNVGIGTASPDRTLTVNGTADKVGGGSWDTFSDERLKTIKGRFTPGLKAVMQLQPVRYEYKPDNALGLRSSGEHIGFGAQAVQKIIPEAVSKNDKGYLLVNNDPILWTMLNAIKEQQQQLQEKHASIEKLEARLAALETVVKHRSLRRRPRR